MKSKRPWSKYAKIERIERNNGDVKFQTCAVLSNHKGIDQCIGGREREEFEDLASAEAHLNTWWETKWKPWDAVQEKSRRRV